MAYIPPPNIDAEAWMQEIRLVPRRLRDDAAQQSWCDALAGKDAMHSIRAFKYREKRHGVNGYVGPDECGRLIVTEPSGKVVHAEHQNAKTANNAPLQSNSSRFCRA